MSSNNNILDIYINYLDNRNTLLNNIINLCNIQENNLSRVLNYYTNREQRQRNNQLNIIGRRVNNFNRNYSDNITSPINIPINRNNRNNGFRERFRNRIRLYNRNRNLNINSEELNYDNLEPVYVVPSTQLIERVTETITFQEIENPQYTTCPITLQTFENNTILLKIIDCGHYFEYNSLMTWFNQNIKCPICRFDIEIQPLIIIIIMIIMII